MIKKTSATCLFLLVGCAPVQPEGSSPGPAPVRVWKVAEVVDTTSLVMVEAERARFSNAACRTGPMPTARSGSLDQPRASMPTAPSLGPLPYIPNSCPVTAGPLARKAVPAVYPATPKQPRP